MWTGVRTSPVEGKIFCLCIFWSWWVCRGVMWCGGKYLLISRLLELVSVPELVSVWGSDVVRHCIHVC